MNKDLNKQWVISYGQLGLLLFTFTLGVILALLITNSQIGAPTSFTTTELIGFVLSVLLSGASIVLAVTAIALGKSSEQAVIKRSDESIRLQTEVFAKTTEALQRIESSTGVTEKRIEDIISGRVGDISHQLAELATKRDKRRPKDFKELEKEIRTSLIKTIKRDRSSEEIETKKQQRIESKKKSKIYQDAHEKVLYTIANKENVKVEKIGHGSTYNEGDELFDGIFNYNNQRIAVSTFNASYSITDLTEYLSRVASELSKNLIQKAIIILIGNEKGEQSPSEIENQLAILKPDISQAITILPTNYKDITADLESLKF